jgi:hypothetical protein
MIKMVWPPRRKILESAPQNWHRKGVFRGFHLEDGVRLLELKRPYRKGSRRSLPGEGANLSSAVSDIARYAGVYRTRLDNHGLGPILLETLLMFYMLSPLDYIPVCEVFSNDPRCAFTSAYNLWQHVFRRRQGEIIFRCFRATINDSLQVCVLFICSNSTPEDKQSVL